MVKRIKPNFRCPPKPWKKLTVKAAIDYIYTFNKPKVPKGDYPCYYCCAEGKLYDPEDYNIIEGYKLADKKVVCEVCNGTGFLSKKEFMEYFREKKKEYHQNMALYNDAIEKFNGLYDKLTDEEYRLLELHFNKNVLCSLGIKQWKKILEGI